jgi:hypothetical protein
MATLIEYTMRDDKATNLLRLNQLALSLRSIDLDTEASIVETAIPLYTHNMIDIGWDKTGMPVFYASESGADALISDSPIVYS